MRKNRLIISSLIGLTALSAVSLSFSVAWYASSDRLSVSALDLSVSTSPLLKVSTSNELSSFVQELDLNSDEYEKDSEKFLFKPVSSMFQGEWLTDEADLPKFYDSSLVASFEGDYIQEATQGFYQKKLYLYTEANYLVSLDQVDSLFDNDETANHLRALEFYASKENAELQLSVEEIETELNKLKDCLRVSILINDVKDPTKIHNRYNIINPTKKEGKDVVLGGILDNDNDGYYDTVPSFDENNNPIEKEFVYGEVNDRSLIKFKDPEIPGYKDEKKESKVRFQGNSFEGDHKKSVYTFDEQASKDVNLEFAKEDALAVNELEDSDKGILIPCYANEPREIVVSIYLEGWDPSCINGTMGASFNTKLSFKILRGFN